MFEEILARVGEQEPTVHCITNFVTVNDCANIILACGGKPTMAHHVGEVAEIILPNGGTMRFKVLSIERS